MDEENDKSAAPEIAGEAVCISCGAAVDSQRSRCPECGLSQRRLRLTGNRYPIWPIAAVVVVAGLLVTALIWMMVGDQKAAPARAFSRLKSDAESNRCEPVLDRLSSAGRAAYANDADLCEALKGFDWDQVSISSVTLDGSEHATICVSKPPGAGLALQKEGGRWLFDSAVPALRDGCTREATAVG